jgi:hypothetical protein
MNIFPPAHHELKDAIQFYNDQFQGLGDQFFAEFKNTVNL